MTLYLGRTAVNATLAVGNGGNVDDVQVDGVSVVTNKVAEIDLTGKQDVISDLSAIRSGASAGATAVQPSDLATVATSGSYNDLDDKPTIPAAQVNSDWNSSSGVSQILNKPTLGTMAAENTTSYYTKTELDGKLNSAMHFKGTKARVADLPSSGQEVGDMWNVQSTGANYAWDGSSWDKLSENIDLSGLQPNLTSSNAGTGISITGSGSNVVISNTQTSAEWGNITGTLSSQTDLQTALGNKQDTISDLATIRSGASAGSTAVQPSDLATVATSGSYNDLSNKPTIPTVNDATLTITQGGTTKGTFTANASSNVTIDLDAGGGGSVDVDNKSITTNISDEIQTVGVINSRDNSTAIKTWTGTKAQYDALKVAHIMYQWEDYESSGISVYTETSQWNINFQDPVYDSSYNIIGRVTYLANTSGDSFMMYDGSDIRFYRPDTDDSTTTIYENRIDPNTLYNITDDTDVSLTILEALYPVGSVYITTAASCPLSTLISGSTWELVSSGRVLQGADSGHSAGTTIEAGLPNISGTMPYDTPTGKSYLPTGSFYRISGTGVGWSGDKSYHLGFDASRSSSIYGNSTTVQPPAYVVNIYRRTA